MKRGFLLLPVVLLEVGCATITTSEMQSVMVTARLRSGEPVDKAECTLQSPKGSWKVTTPSSVLVPRDAEDMQVECRKDGAPSGTARLVSRAHGGMFGNIIFGGVIGAVIDHSKGTGYEYPGTVEIVMGESRVIDRANEVEPAAATPAAATAQPAAVQECAQWQKDLKRC